MKFLRESEKLYADVEFYADDNDAQMSVWQKNIKKCWLFVVVHTNTTSVRKIRRILAA